ncbi:MULTISPECIES: serine/threonine protein kinase [unclassified Pseudofrankia]|uniref:serine/threonine protein kinase n=1 Tax=unclassified Pseudofrankia TaxID=2994372 RepID=UPI001F516E3B|nr:MULTISPECIES: serine/threonine protein kinase [unclassified Pseudofrankia]MDT3443663.1 serine/threonine protein kinase [Pseudofrankia sp. BMG5.37]
MLAGAACVVVLIVGISVLAWAPWGSGREAQAGPAGGGPHGRGKDGAATGPDGSSVPKSGKSDDRARSAAGGAAQGAGEPGPAGQGIGAADPVAGGTSADVGTEPGSGSGSGSGAGSSGATSGTGTGSGSGSTGSSPGTTAARTTAPAPSGSSTATKNPYTAAQVCGSGYSEIDSHTLTSGSTTAKIVLMYNGSNNCVVTLKAGAGVGTAQSMSAWVQAQNGSSKVTDSGSYQYYAGPTKVSAKAICVKWGGSLGSVSWGSDWSHCG